MDFDTVLAHVRQLLQRQGRVSYRALRLRFQLDDESLAALKDELIYAERVARDEEDRVLAWVGEADTTAEPSGQSFPLLPPDTAPTEPRTPEAERRQLTVLFCDLVDSTVLAAQLDPEDWREVVRAYQATCAEVIQRYEGHIAQYLGDGLLVYFGYPQAHEDDARRAVYTGLEILVGMQRLNTRLERERRVQLAVCLGIHTGLVVVGEMGGSGRQEQLALGEGRPLSWAPSAHAVAGGRPMWQPGSRDSQRPMPWSLVPLPSDWYRDTLPTTSLICTPSRVWRHPSRCIVSSEKVRRRVAWMWGVSPA
jgi:class 3 adenylate cyclase